MTKEQKEELVNMDWRTIIKEERKKPQTRIAGGNPNDKPKGRKRGTIMDMEEDRAERQELANATREDLMDKVMDMIGSMSEDALIDLLMTSLGEVEVRDIGIRKTKDLTMGFPADNSHKPSPASSDIPDVVSLPPKRKGKKENIPF